MKPRCYPLIVVRAACLRTLLVLNAQDPSLPVLIARLRADRDPQVRALANEASSRLRR